VFHNYHCGDLLSCLPHSRSRCIYTFRLTLIYYDAQIHVEIYRIYTSNFSDMTSSFHESFAILYSITSSCSNKSSIYLTSIPRLLLPFVPGPRFPLAIFCFPFTTTEQHLATSWVKPLTSSSHHPTCKSAISLKKVAPHPFMHGESS
jgi:hypothetical protein